jgi:hypothetical protein
MNKKVLVLTEPDWLPITSDVILIPEGKTPEQAYVMYIRKFASDESDIDYDEEECERVASLTDEEILNECELHWQTTDLIII